MTSTKWWGPGRGGGSACAKLCSRESSRVDVASGCGHVGASDGCGKPEAGRGRTAGTIVRTAPVIKQPPGAGRGFQRQHLYP